MKITGQNPPRTGELTQSKSREVDARGGKPQVRETKTAEPAATRASLTLNKVKDAIRNTPEVRSAKVAELRERVRAGEYRVDSGRVAEKMINASLREDIERS
jgi:negative regulator of flagellin synthesis FlgM